MAFKSTTASSLGLECRRIVNKYGSTADRWARWSGRFWRDAYKRTEELDGGFHIVNRDPQANSNTAWHESRGRQDWAPLKEGHCIAASYLEARGI